MSGNPGGEDSHAGLCARLALRLQRSRTTAAFLIGDTIKVKLKGS
jgi:hypothetical protein